MCSPIKFTRPGARTTCTGPGGEGGAPNARANAAARGAEAMRLEISRKDRCFARAALQRRSFAPLAEKLVLRACGAQDDRLARFAQKRGRETTLPFLNYSSRSRAALSS